MVALCIVAVGFIAGCGSGQSETPLAPAQSSGPLAINVLGYIPKYEPLEQLVYATGSILSNESVEIRSERAGKITGIHFQEGGGIRQGALLFSLDQEELLAQQRKLEVQKEYLTAEVARARELSKIQAITGEELERITNELNQTDAELDLIAVYLSKTRIYAPFSGTMGLRQVSTGAYVTPADVLVRIDQTNPVKLEFEVPERYRHNVRQGQKLSFTVTGVDRLFSADVYAMSSQITPATRSFTVRARCPNAESLLKPGHFARIELVTGIDEEAILVPTDAVLPVIEGQKIFIKRGGRAIATYVETGLRQDDRVQILSGLTVGDTLLTTGLLLLSDGIPVNVTEVVSSTKPHP